VLVGVFLAGAVAGGFVSLRVEDRIVERGRAPAQFAPRLLQHLSDRLELTDEQRVQVRLMVGEAWEELREQRQASRETMRWLDEQVISVLTAEQQELYAKIQERQRRRWQAMEERRGERLEERRRNHDGALPPYRDRPPGPPPGRNPPSD